MQTRIDAFLRRSPTTPVVAPAAPAAPVAPAVPRAHAIVNALASRVVPRPENAMNKPNRPDALLLHDPATATAIDAYTDGACPSNGRGASVAGAGVAFPDHPELNVSETIREGKPTNNRAELLAILRAIEVADERIDPRGRRTLRVFTDSMLCVNTFTKWVAGWKRNGWLKRDGKPVLNAELIRAIDARMVRRRVEFKHVRAHTGRQDRDSRFNAMADELAVAATSRR